MDWLYATLLLAGFALIALAAWRLWRLDGLGEEPGQGGDRAQRGGDEDGPQQGVERRGRTGHGAPPHVASGRPAPPAASR